MVLAYVLVSTGEAHVSRSLSSLNASAIDKCGQIRNEELDEQINASLAVALVRHPPDANGLVADPERGTHDVPIFFLAPNGYARRIPCVGDVQGLSVSRGSLLEDLHIEGLLWNHLPQLCVLFLQRIQLLGNLWFHATVLLPAAVHASVR